MQRFYHDNFNIHRRLVLLEAIITPRFDPADQCTLREGEKEVAKEWCFGETLCERNTRDRCLKFSTINNHQPVLLDTALKKPDENEVTKQVLSNDVLYGL